jgi:hypothetical protein
MSNPLTPSLPLEPKPGTIEALTKRVREKISKEMSKAPQEVRNTHVLGRSQKSQGIDFCFYIPHNYRLIFDFNPKNFGKSPFINPRVPKPRGTPLGLGTLLNSKTMNHGSTHFYKFDHASVWVKRKSIEIHNRINHKKAYAIPITSDADKEIKKIIKSKDLETRGILESFIECYGGSSSGTILKRSSEDKVQGDKALDTMDPNSRFRNEVGKKVYHEPNFEFVGPEFASNYIKNRAIENIAPEICNELERNGALLKGVLDSVRAILEINRDTASILNRLAKSQEKLHHDDLEKQQCLMEYDFE